MQSKKIACIGNLTQDHLFSVDALPELDDVGYVHGAVDCVGGRGAIVALTLGRMGHQRVDLVTVLPLSDRTGDNLRFLEDNFVATEGVGIDSKATREHEVTVALSREDRNCISFFRPGDVRFEANETQKALVGDSDVAYFSTHKRSFNTALMESIDPEKTTVIHNVSSYLSSDDEYRTAMLAKSRILICNEQEAAALAAREGVGAVTDLFNQSTILRSIYLTRGENGSIVYGHQGSEEHFGIQECEVRAPVGAGDTYAAGIIHGVARDWTVSQGVTLAARLAALSVSSHTSYPDLPRVQGVLREVEQYA